MRQLGPQIRVQLVRWEKMSFVEKLTTFQNMDVQVTGVGSAQMNTFLLPAGAVSVCLGWRHQDARKKIYYFDSHRLNALDHVRVIYYPDYDPWELAPARPANETGETGANVRLNITKATAIVRSALELQAAGFEVPVREGLNANHYDRAYEEMARRSNGAWVGGTVYFRTAASVWALSDIAACALPRV